MLAEETTPQTVLSTVVLLGKDNGGKFHASRFPSDQAEAALRAARLMKLRALKVTDAELDAAVQQLPEGKIYATGPWRRSCPQVIVGLLHRVRRQSPSTPATSSAEQLATPPQPGRRETLRHGTSHHCPSRAAQPC